ncbi:hypothetical protein LCGC14_2500230, partial [marine sediment metagenome]
AYVRARDFVVASFNTVLKYATNLFNRATDNIIVGLRSISSFLLGRIRQVFDALKGLVSSIKNEVVGLFNSLNDKLKAIVSKWVRYLGEQIDNLGIDFDSIRSRFNTTWNWIEKTAKTLTTEAISKLGVIVNDFYPTLKVFVNNPQFFWVEWASNKLLDLMFDLIANELQPGDKRDTRAVFEDFEDAS